MPSRLDGESVLLIDDTWTTGANARSAAAALRAGAGAIAVLVIGRHLHRDYGDNRRAAAPSLPTPFDWEACAHHLTGEPETRVRRRTSLTGVMWWDNAVIYQVYLRSFQDSDGDGIGDLPGRARRLEHIAKLGAGAVWLSPVYPSPNADFGYDVSDFTAVDPAFGTLADLDALIARAHDLGLRVLLDFVPCHTSIEHPWFREHPEYYVWADEIPNNWRAAFGGPAWELDRQTGRYYLSSFFPEQADLDWHNPRAPGRDGRRAALLGAAGSRRIPARRAGPDLQGRRAARRAARHRPAAAAAGSGRRRARAPVFAQRARRRRRRCGRSATAVGDALLVGEVFLPAAELGPYLESLDVCFSFETMFAVGDAEALTAAITTGLQHGRPGWVLSNHDFDRLVTRAGPGNGRATALLLLSLPGARVRLPG